MDRKNISFRSSMSGSELAGSIAALKGDLSSYKHDLRLENNEFVVYLRKPTFSEKLKSMLMTSSMKLECQAHTKMIIREIGQKTGMDGEELLRTISSDKKKVIRDPILEASTRVALQSALLGSLTN